MMVFLQNDDVTLMIVCSGRLNWSCRTSFPGAALLCITPIVLLGTQIHKYRYTYTYTYKYTNTYNQYIQLNLNKIAFFLFSSSFSQQCPIFYKLQSKTCGGKIFMPHVDFIFTFHFPPSIFIHMVKKVLIQIHCKPRFSGYLWSCGLAGHALFKTQVGGKHTQLLFHCMLVCVYVWCTCVCACVVDIMLLLSASKVKIVDMGGEKDANTK